MISRRKKMNCFRGLGNLQARVWKQKISCPFRFARIESFFFFFILEIFLKNIYNRKYNRSYSWVTEKMFLSKPFPRLEVVSNIFSPTRRESQCCSNKKDFWEVQIERKGSSPVSLQGWDKKRAGVLVRHSVFLFKTRFFVNCIPRSYPNYNFGSHLAHKC